MSISRQLIDGAVCLLRPAGSIRRSQRYCGWPGVSPKPRDPAAHTKEGEQGTSGRWSADSSLDYDRGLFELLRGLRRPRSRRSGVSRRTSCSGTHRSCRWPTFVPHSRESFSRITGVGATKLEEYGETFVEHITRVCRAARPRREGATAGAVESHGRSAGPARPTQRRWNCFRQGLSI